MSRFKSVRSMIILGLAAFAAPVFAEVPILQNDRASLSIGGMGQVLGLGQSIHDPFKDDNRLFLFLKEARLRAHGQYDGFSMNLELALGGEDVVVAPSPGVALSLLDLSFDVPIHVLGNSFLTVGQFKVPYGRERLTYSGDLLFIDRSLQDFGFRVGRDVGAALTLRPGLATIILGVFTGGGRDVPERFLPEKVGIPMFVARAGIGNADPDPYALRQSDLELDRLRAGVFVNGLYTKDSLVGHSTALNVKMADKSVLLNSNWNPYIGQTPLTQGQWWQAGLDGVIRIPVGAVAASAEGEVNYGEFTNTYGGLHTVGLRAQAGARVNAFELALRYSALFPSARFAVGSNPITGTEPMHELTPALTWYIRGRSLKLVADLPVLFRAPVITEPNVGTYVATEQPDQTKVLTTGGSVARQNVLEGRLMFQALF